MVQDFITYLLMQEPNVRWVVFGMLIFSMATSVVGSLTFLQKKSLIGDAVSHSLLPGICLAFIFFQTKSIAVLLGGAVISGWLSISLIDFITKKSKLSSDTVIAVVLTTFFGLGIFLLSYIQQFDNANQAGLNKFLFGAAASIVKQDVYIFIAVAAIILGVVFLFFKEFKLLIFDRDFAAAKGLPVASLDFIFSTLIILAIAIGIQTVGVVLMSAMLIAPAAAARYWTDSLARLMMVAVVFGFLASYLGAFVSYTSTGMPTGPWVVVFLSFFAFLSILFAPKRGVLHRFLQQRETQKRIAAENVLKAFVYIGQLDKQVMAKRNWAELIDKSKVNAKNLKKTLKRLTRKKGLIQEQDTWQLTEAGAQRGYQLIKLHRLWELYLTEYMNIASDHVHNDAEAIEHIITPEIEKQLEEKLGHPILDPHGSPIDLRTKTIME